jgi:hypothetical protein
LPSRADEGQLVLGAELVQVGEGFVEHSAGGSSACLDQEFVT